MVTAVAEAGTAGETHLVRQIRRLLLAILILGLAGCFAELLLLKHHEDIYQWIPLILLAGALPAAVWNLAGGGAVGIWLLRWLMTGFVAAGLAGIYFHFQGSAEFKLESQPNLAGMALFWAAIGAKNPPLLAPGAMVQLGLLGWASTYGHPLLKRSR